MGDLGYWWILVSNLGNDAINTDGGSLPVISSSKEKKYRNPSVAGASASM